MRLRLSSAKNHCQNSISVCVCVCVCWHNTVISLQTALGSCETYSSPKPSCGNRFTFRLINTRIDTSTIALRHTDPSAQTHRGRTSHLVPWRRSICEKLEWHQLRSDKNGFGPGCWLSNTFWYLPCRGRFIRSQIRCLTFTPKHTSRTARRQTELMHSITPCSLPRSFHFELLKVPHYFWKVWEY